MTCSIENCNRAATRKGMCNAHYLRWWRHGDATHGGIMRGTATKFILDHVKYSGNECLIWPFARNKTGYPDVNFPGISGLGHRVMCILAHGEPPSPDDEAAHSCGNGHNGCINPNHLSWKTRLQNIHDKKEHGTQLWGDTVHFAKLTVEQAIEIKYGGMKSSEAALKFGVSANTVNNIRAGKTWKGI